MLHFVDVDILEFNEKNVRNAIIGVRNVRELGERLKIPAHLLDEMEKHKPEDQKLKLVEAWFKVDHDCNWDTLNDAMDKTRMTEWLQYGHRSTSGSLSDAPLSPKSNGSTYYSSEPPPGNILYSGPLIKDPPRIRDHLPTKDTLLNPLIPIYSRTVKLVLSDSVWAKKKKKSGLYILKGAIIYCCWDTAKDRWSLNTGGHRTGFTVIHF